MSIATTCPSCDASYQLADSMLGKKVRCKSCEEIFVVRSKSRVPDRDEDEERIQSSPRPAKRVVRDEEDEDEERSQPRRRPRKKSGNSALVPLIIGGCVVAVVLLVVVGGIAVWVLRAAAHRQVAQVASSNLPPVAQPAQNPAPQNQPNQPFPPGGRNFPPNNGNANPPPMFPPGNQPGQNPMPAQGPLAVELTNGKVSGFGAQMQVEINYRFTSGNPAGKRLYLLIKATKAMGLRQNYYVAELRSVGNKTQGTINASGMSFGAEHGPFEMWMGEGSVGPGLMISDRDLKKISNVVTVASKQMTLPGPGGVRPPIGPRGIPRP
ncbi:MAG TPA: zinc-ribbon domain-containing protein [Gemmataceae bacterium]|jgi:predicted Zn finger-like uncharacterized protein